ncbi:YolD-like family protein [Sporosarcina contaminans]|uniref:YolD-like family protein n=1 Tax=Sporosarcina contaminans TaxID=633403 RepID=A0ABW3U1U6_9BACL
MMDKNRDRGIIKWTAMMLPEHIQMLRALQEENEYIERPKLTEWELQDLQEELERAYKMETDSNITVWSSGRTDTYIGKIVALDPIRGLISVEGPYGKDNIPVSDIIKVHSM